MTKFEQDTIRLDADLLRDLVRHEPYNAAALAALGEQAWEDGQARQSLRNFRKAIRLETGNASYHLALGRVLKEMGRTRDAIRYFEASSRIDPSHAAPYVWLSCCYLERENLRDQATSLSLQAIRNDPTSEPAYSQLGDCIALDRHLDQSLIELRRLTGSHGLDPRMAHLGLQNALIERGRYYDARACNEQMLRVMPGSAVGFANLGRIAVAMHDIPTALKNFEEALRLDPTNYYFSILYMTGWMQLGDYERARAEFNHRRSCFPIQNYRSPPWRGESVKNATIVVNAGVAGFGDAIQSIRLARVIHEEGARVIVKTRRELVRLFRTVPGVDLVHPNDETSPEASFECGADEVAFQRSLGRDTYASFVPYVFPSSPMTNVWKGRVTPDKFNVGIVWRGADLAMNDPYRQRSMPLDKFRPLLNLSGIQLYSLQRARGAEELTLHGRSFPAIPLGSACRDFLDLAGAISALDLVISVDTSVAHLSGALGKPTWVLIPYAPVDWRWQIGCEDDIWYPSVRLFRQQEPGDWDEVVGRVVRALPSLVRSLGRSQIPHGQAESTSLPEAS